MCTVSMVHDHFAHKFEDYPSSLSDWVKGSTTTIYPQTIDLVALRKLIDDFNAAIEAAKTVDILTKQPDCVDPEKAKLQDQVKRLEAMIDALLDRK